MAAFIDNVIIETEEEEEHDEIIEEVIRRLAENDLYIKPEKCRWKVREVGFLGVVIRLEGIKMEEEKVKDVLDWPTLKRDQRHTEILRISELLLSIYQRFCSHS